MAKPALIAKLTCQDGKRDEAVAAFGQMFDHVKANEPGTLVYALHADAKDPNVLYFYELYQDQDSLNAHGSSDTMKAVGRQLKDILAGRMELTFLEPLSAKGIEI